MAVTLPTNSHHIELIRHLRELLRHCDALVETHTRWNERCGPVGDALRKLDFEIRWEIDRAKWEHNWLAEHQAEKAAAAFRALRKRAKTIAQKKARAFAENGRSGEI